MTAHDPTPELPIAHAIVSLDGMLQSADPALVALNARAGGAIGAPVAVPQLATIIRLARRLGIIVSRGVVVADEDVDIDLWVRAQPEGDTIRLAVSGWREMPAWRPAVSRDARADFVRSGTDWRWETDAALRLTFLSLEAGPIHGFDAFALLGKPLTALFVLDTQGDGGLPILDSLARRRPLAAQPARLRGSDKPVTLTAEVRHDADGAFAGFVGGARMVVADIAAPELEDDTLSADFTSGLDRALRKPLARIVANADSINAQADGPVQADYADYAADIASAGRHLLELVDDLVDLQAVERPDFTLAVEPIDLADVARRAAGLLTVRASNADVTIARPSPAASVPAMGDFRRVLQILVNLIGNAVRYSPPGALVSVTVTGGAGVATVLVADQGKGVAPEDQARIFDKFERVDPSEPGGSGLGLFIARRLARAMQGDLEIESEPGEGARFALTLPAQPPRGENQ